MTEIDGGTFEDLRLAAAMKAHIADQKAVMVFQEAHDGGAALYSFRALGHLDDIHHDLLTDAVEFHTIVPTPDGPVVHVVDMEGTEETAHAVGRAVARYDAPVDIQHGHAAFIQGTDDTGSDREQRDSSGAAYEGIISATRHPGARALWQRIHSSYGSTLDLAETEGELRWWRDHLGRRRPAAGADRSSHPADQALCRLLRRPAAGALPGPFSFDLCRVDRAIIGVYPAVLRFYTIAYCTPCCFCSGGGRGTACSAAGVGVLRG